MSSQDESVEFDQRGLLRLLARHLGAIALCALIGLLLAAALLVVQGRKYTSTAQIEVGPPLTLDSLVNTGNSNQTRSANSSSTDAGIVTAEAGFINGRELQNRVEQRLRPRHPAYEVTAGSSQSSNIVTINATSTDARTSQDVAATYATAYLDYVAANNKQLIGTAKTQLTRTIQDLQQRIDDLSRPLQTATSTTLPQVQAQVGASRDALVQRSVDLQTQLDAVELTEVASPSGQTRLASAATPPQPGSRSTTLALGLIAGLFVGVLFAAAREMTNGRVMDEADVAAAVSAPLLADLRVSVPRQLSSDPIAQDGEEDESYRALAASLWPQHRDTAGRKVWMVSSSTRDGAAAVILVVRLARQLSRLGRRVVILGVDTWPNRPAGSPGLAEVIRAPQSLPQHVLSYENGKVLVLPRGAENPAEALASPNFATVLKQIADQVDVVLFVSPPLLASADPLMLAPLCDGILLAVERRVTRRRTLSLVGRRLERLPIDSALGGVVLQGGRRRGRGPRRTQLVAPVSQVVTSSNRTRVRAPSRPVSPLAMSRLRALLRAGA